MRESCNECPSLEDKESGDWCFYYQRWTDVDKPCGNTFEEKPEFTQEEYEEITAISEDYTETPTMEMDRIFKETGEWPDKFNEDIKQSVEKAKEEMRKRKNKDIIWERIKAKIPNLTVGTIPMHESSTCSEDSIHAKWTEDTGLIITKEEIKSFDGHNIELHYGKKETKTDT